MCGSSSWIRKERRLAIYIRDGFTCCYCGKDLANVSPREMGLDHLEDLVDGGGHKGANHDGTNLVTSCALCNSQRGARDWRNYAPGGAAERIEAQRYMPLNLVLAKAILAGTAEWADR